MGHYEQYDLFESFYKAMGYKELDKTSDIVG